MNEEFWQAWKEKKKPTLTDDYAGRKISADELRRPLPEAQQTQQQQIGASSDCLIIDTEEKARERIQLIQEKREREQRRLQHLADVQQHYRTERHRADIDHRLDNVRRRLLENLAYSEDWDGAEPSDDYVYAFRNAIGAERAEAVNFLERVAREGLSSYRSIPAETSVLLLWLAHMIWSGEHTK